MNPSSAGRLLSLSNADAEIVVFPVLFDLLSWWHRFAFRPTVLPRFQVPSRPIMFMFEQMAGAPGSLPAIPRSFSAPNKQMAFYLFLFYGSAMSAMSALDTRW